MLLLLVQHREGGSLASFGELVCIRCLHHHAIQKAFGYVVLGKLADGVVVDLDFVGPQRVVLLEGVQEAPKDEPRHLPLPQLVEAAMAHLHRELFLRAAFLLGRTSTAIVATTIRQPDASPRQEVAAEDGPCL